MATFLVVYLTLTVSTSLSKPEYSGHTSDRPIDTQVRASVGAVVEEIYAEDVSAFASMSAREAVRLSPTELATDQGLLRLREQARIHACDSALPHLSTGDTSADRQVTCVPHASGGFRRVQPARVSSHTVNGDDEAEAGEEKGEREAGSVNTGKRRKNNANKKVKLHAKEKFSTQYVCNNCTIQSSSTKRSGFDYKMLISTKFYYNMLHTIVDDGAALYAMIGFIVFISSLVLPASVIRPKTPSYVTAFNDRLAAADAKLVKITGAGTAVYDVYAASMRER